MYHSFFIHSSIEGHLARKSVESDPRCGRPTTSRIPESVEHVQATINNDCRVTEWDLEADLGIPKLLCLRFWCRILAWTVSWQNSFCSFCYQSRRNIVLQLLMTSFKRLPMNQISSRRLLLEIYCRPVVMIRKWRPSCPSWSHLILHAQNGVAKLQQNQDHVNCVFWLGRCCPSWVCSSKPNN